MSRTGVVSPRRPRSRSTPSKIRTCSQSAWLAGTGLATDARQLRNEPRELGEAGAGGIGDPGGVDVVHQGAKRLDDRAEGEPVVTEGDRSPLEHEPVAGSKLIGQLGDEPGLADARLATDEDQRGFAGHRGAGRTEERGQLPWSDRRRPGWRGAESCRG